jgi:hypothetical protein
MSGQVWVREVSDPVPGFESGSHSRCAGGGGFEQVTGIEQVRSGGDFVSISNIITVKDV